MIEKGAGPEAPYSIRQVGIYLVVDTEAGLVLLWDRKTSIFLRLSPEFKVRPSPWTKGEAGGVGCGGKDGQTDRVRERGRQREGQTETERERGVARLCLLGGGRHGGSYCG